MSKSLRIVYAAGPGNVLATFRKWRSGEDDTSEMVPTYSGQFFDFCLRHGHSAWVVAAHEPEEGPEHAEAIQVRHRPVFWPHGPSLGYHFGQLWSAMLVIWDCVRFRADTLVIVSGTCHWFPLTVLRWCGIDIVVSIHNRLWLLDHRPGWLRRVLMKLDARFYRRTVRAIISASAELSQQIRELTDQQSRPIHEYLPMYQREMFSQLAPPPSNRVPFRVLFVGRLENNKGVDDLFAIAQRFEREGHRNIEFDLCGAGTDLERLRQQASESGLSERFRLHGHSNRAQVLGFLSSCHLVIVPTTSRFNEGFNQVVVEGILAGRPVISSAMCPAIDYVRPGVVEVPVDDVQAYGDAILMLRDDVGRYRALCDGAKQCQEPFFDSHRSWAAALERALQG